MLFDLRGRGRRRTVQIVYGALAVIFAFAFVGVGVGTGFGTNFNIGELFSSKGASTSYQKQVTAARKRTQKEPHSAAAWAALVRAQIRESGEAEYTNQSAGGYTAKGKKYLAKVQASWERYLELEPKNPNVELAHLILPVLSEEGIDQPKAEVQALQIVIAAEPSNRALYAELAQYAYQAGNTREGDLAAEKAVSLTPKSEQAVLKGRLAALKKEGGHLSASSTTTGEEG